MEILFPVLIGACFGALWAAGEIWVFLLGQKRAEKQAADILSAGGEEAKIAAGRHRANYVMKYFLCKIGLDILMLASIFLAKDFLSLRWEYVLLAAGIVLAMFTQLVFVRLAKGGK